jgi:hypothetical protein
VIRDFVIRNFVPVHKGQVEVLPEIPSVKGLRGRWLAEFIDWRYIQSSVMLVFSTQLWELLPI